MAHFVLRYQGDGEAPASALNTIRAMPDIQALDSSSRMMLIDAPTGAETHLRQQFPDWMVVPEQSYSVPDTKHHVTTPPANIRE